MEFNDVVELNKKVFELSFLNRYNSHPRIVNENLTTHMYSVAFVSMLLYDYYKSTHNGLDLPKILKMALIHDVCELETSDVSHVAKSKYKELKQVLDRIEEDFTKETFKDEQYVNLMKEFNVGESVEAQIVKMADAMSCVIYADNELKLGNQSMQRVSDQSKKRVEEMRKRLKK